MNYQTLLIVGAFFKNIKCKILGNLFPLLVIQRNAAARRGAKVAPALDESLENEAVHFTRKTTAEIVGQIKRIFNRQTRTRPHLFQPGSQETKPDKSNSMT